MSMKTMTYRLVGLVFGALVPLAPASAAVVIEVDVSNRTAVTFTSTGANAQNDDSSFDTNTGITLIGFFVSAADASDLNVLGDLTAAGATVPYDLTFSLDEGTGDLNLFTDESFPIEMQTFSTSTPAFSGSSTVDLSSQTTALPAIGAMGDILVGDGLFSDFGPVVGQYEVVPLPAAAWLLVPGIAALAAGQRFRRRKGSDTAAA